jgi:hypothetical protein
MVFGNKEKLHNPYYDPNENCNKPIDVCLECNDRFVCKTQIKRSAPEFYPADELAENIFSQLGGQRSLSRDKIAEELTHGSFSGEARYRHYPEPTDKAPQGSEQYNQILDRHWKEERERQKIAADKVADEFIATNPNSKYYIFTYSDESGEGYMEHEMPWKLPMLRISKH